MRINPLIAVFWNDSIDSQNPRIAPSVTPRFPLGFVARGLERGDSYGGLRTWVFSDSNVARGWVLLQVIVDRASIDASLVNIAVRNWLKLSEQQSGVSARSQSPAFASRMCEEVLVVSGAIADLVDSRYPFIDVVSVCSLWPCLMDDWDPQIAFMAAVRHVGPETQREVRDDIVCGRVLAKAVSQMVDRIPVQSVGVVDLSAFIRPEDRASYGRGAVEQPVVGPAPGGRYCPVVRVSEGDLEERDVFQDGLRKTDVPEVEAECDGVIASCYFEIFAISGFRKPRYDVRPVYLRSVRHWRPFLRK